MSEPSVKGSIFVPAAAQILELRGAGRVPEEVLQTTLEPRDLELLEQKLLEASWYPMETYARYLELLCRVEARGDPRWYDRRGAATAKRLLEAGLYAQLEILGRLGEGAVPRDTAGAQRAVAAYRSKMNLMVSLAGSIYNVGRWKAVADPDHPGRVCIEVREAEPYSEGMALSIEGFLNGLTRAVRPDLERLYRMERPAPDHLRFRMERDLADLRPPR